MLAVSPMSLPKILVFAGSIRSGSHNARLAALATKELALAGVEVTRISLEDYPLPLYDGDLEGRSGPPENALKLKRLIGANHGVFIASPEYNASVTPLLKNTIDWISRVHERGEAPLAVFKNRVFAIGGASDGAYGAMRSLLALRQVLELGCGALVIPEQVAVMRASEAFDEMDNLMEERSANALKRTLQRLTEMARELV
jgi:NAD(P)H-dependent FMN reductase